MESVEMRARRWLIIAALAAVAVALCFVCYRLFILKDSSDSLPTSQTFGIVLIEIGDSEAQASFHVPEKGVYVLAVEENSPAAKAGILSGDRITAVNQTAIVNSTDFYEQCAAAGANSKVTITLTRGNSENPMEFPLEIRTSDGG